MIPLPLQVGVKDVKCNKQFFSWPRSSAVHTARLFCIHHSVHSLYLTQAAVHMSTSSQSKTDQCRFLYQAGAAGLQSSHEWVRSGVEPRTGAWPRLVHPSHGAAAARQLLKRRAS